MSKKGEELEKMYKSIKKNIPFTPKIGIVLGSGLGEMLDKVKVEGTISYKDIKGFPYSTAPGHKGQYVFVHIGGVPCVLMQGRVHYYEGWDIDQVVTPQRLMALMGVKLVILTNASGGMYDGVQVGDIMMITDQITSFVPSPIRGENVEELGPRFADMTDIYTKDLRQVAKETAKKVGLPLKEGVYVQLSGPQFETPAEIRFYKAMGWGAAGMSTAVEAVALRHAGVKVLGFSMITNLAAGLSSSLIDGGDVIETANKKGPIFTKFIMTLVEDVAKKI